MDVKSRAGILMLLRIEFSTLLILLEKKIMTPQECLQRLQATRQSAELDPDTAPAMSLIDGVIALVEGMIHVGWPLTAQGAPAPSEQKIEQFLREWASSTKH